MSECRLNDVNKNNTHTHTRARLTDDSSVHSPVVVADDGHRVRHATRTTRVDWRLRHHLTYHVAMATVVGRMHLPDACLLHQVVGFRVLRVS